MARLNPQFGFTWTRTWGGVGADRAAGVMFVRLVEQRLQDRRNRAGLPAASVTQDGNVATEELVQTDFDVIVLKNHRLADGQNSVSRGPFGLASAAVQAD